MKRLWIVGISLLLAVAIAACSPYEPGTVIVVQNGTTAPTATTPAETTPTVTTAVPTAATTPAVTTSAATTADTTPAATTPAATTPVATPADTTPAATTPAATTPVATTPANTTSAVTTPVDTTPAVTTPATTTPAATTAPDGTEAGIDWSATVFVLNTNTKKFHMSTCRYAGQIKAENRREVVGTSELTENYSPCKVCLPGFTLGHSD